MRGKTSDLSGNICQVRAHCRSEVTTFDLVELCKVGAVHRLVAEDAVYGEVLCGAEAGLRVMDGGIKIEHHLTGAR